MVVVLALVAGRHDEALGADGQLTAHGTIDCLSWMHDDYTGSAALRGQATDLLLAIVRRHAIHDLDFEIDGAAQICRADVRTPRPPENVSEDR
jgi:hypothetical protein